MNARMLERVRGQVQIAGKPIGPILRVWVLPLALFPSQASARTAQLLLSAPEGSACLAGARLETVVDGRTLWRVRAQLAYFFRACAIKSKCACTFERSSPLDTAFNRAFHILN